MCTTRWEGKERVCVCVLTVMLGKRRNLLIVWLYWGSSEDCVTEDDSDIGKRTGQLALDYYGGDN